MAKFLVRIFAEFVIFGFLLFESLREKSYKSIQIIQIYSTYTVGLGFLRTGWFWDMHEGMVVRTLLEL